MKASRKVLGLILVIGMLLSCAAASYATAKKAPKFTTSKLAEATWGGEYDATISVSDNTNENDDVVDVTITDTARNAIEGFGFEVENDDDGGLHITGKDLESEALLKLKSGYKFTVTATNKFKKKDTDKNWQNGKTTKDFTLKLKADAPKFVTKALSSFTKADEGSSEIEITGAKPFSIDVYIDKKDVEKAGIGNAAIYLYSNDTQVPDEITGFEVDVTESNEEDKVTVTFSKAAGEGGSFKNLPITIKAQNVVTAINKKPVTKVYKATMTGEAPTWVIVKGPAKLGAATLAAPLLISEDFKEYMFTAKSADALSFSFMASGDGPMKITASPRDGTAGLKIKISADAQSVDVYATSTTEAKTTKLKLVAENGEGKVTFTLSLIGQDAPKIDYDKNKYYKDVEQGKKFSFTPKLKTGTKPIKWYIKSLTAAERTANTALITSADLLASYDITIDEDKGTLTGTPTNVTLSGDNKTFRRKTVLIYAQNAAGSSDVASVDIGVIGSKPKLDKDTKAFTIVRGTKVSGDSYAIKAQDIDSTDIVWTIDSKKGKSKLSDYVKGLDLVSRDGMLSGEPTIATKGVSVPIIMDHYGAKGNASVKITILDPAPKIVSKDGGILLIKNVKVDKNKQKTTSAYTASMTLTMSDDTKATGSSKITWKASKPSNKALSVKLAKGSDANVNSATVTVTLGKGKQLDVNDSNDVLPFEETFTVTATNSGSNKEENSNEITLTIRVTSASVYPTTSDAYEAEEMTIGETKALEEDIVTDEELTTELGEGELTIGTERTVGMLSAGQAAVLDEGRFVIAAILPEINATADGQYGLEVDLAETVKPGAKLYWFAFPKNAPDSEDDQIADFFSLEGADTEVVPEDHVVVVYPWLRNGVTYGPVIAVKAEDAEEGEAVTEEGLEKAAEGEEASETTEVEAPAEEKAE